jgi:parallel beta-helix repeat protein
MTYQFKLSRRMAQARAGALLFALLSATACSNDLQDASDPTELEPPSGEAVAPDVVIGPERVVVEVGQPVQLRARAVAAGRYRTREVPAVDVLWSASGGSISTTGVFTAAKIGTFRVVGRSPGHGKKRNPSDTSVVVVVPPQPSLTAIVVSPSEAELSATGTYAFKAQGILSDSTRVDVGVTWEATGGRIDAAGNYAAGSAPGRFRAVATSYTGEKSDTATIVIDSTAVVDSTPPTPPPAPTLAAVRLSPDTATVASGRTVQFTARARLSDSSVSTVGATYTATGGTINTSGLYTAGSTAGAFTIVAAYQGLADTSTVTIPATAPAPSPPSTCVSSGNRLCPSDNLQTKANAAGSGATLTLQAGLYRMQSVAPLNGQTWVGEPGAIMSGARVLTGWQSDGAGHWYVGGQTQQNSYGASYSCQTGHDGCMYPEQLWIDGVLQEHMTSLGAAPSGSPKWYFDYAGDRIYVAQNPTGRAVETSVTAVAFSGRSTGVRITGLIVERYATQAQQAAVNGGSASQWTIESNEVRDNHGIGISIGADGVMRNNKVHHQGQMGITAKGANALVEGNEIAYNNTAFFGDGHYAETGGSKFVYTTGLVVRNNFAHHNRGPGLWSDINNVGCLYEGNVVEDNEWRGIFHEISYDCVIRNNVVRRNGFNSPGQAGAVEGAGILVSDSRNVEIYGNTVEDNRAGIMAIDADRAASHPSELGEHNTINVYVHNNTVKQSNGGKVGGISDWDGAHDPYTAASNNRWVANTYVIGATAAKWRWSGNADVARTQWQGFGQDSGAVFR